MDLYRKELDELMRFGANTSLNEGKNPKEYYDDPEVCKYQLVSICPHDLFANTKYDLGACPKLHDDIFKTVFLEDNNRHSNEEKYIIETISLFENMLLGVDNKVKMTQEKLSGPLKELEEKLGALEEEIKKLCIQVEQLGQEGKIDEVEICMSQIELLKKKEIEMKAAGNISSGLNSPQMKVCECCGALLVLNATEEKVKAHLEGKLHTGFMILRKELETLKKRSEDLRKEKERDD